MGLSIAFALNVGWLNPAIAHHTDAHFGQSTTYQVVYQFNGSDASYPRSVLFSIGELIRKYGEDIQIVVIGVHSNRLDWILDACDSQTDKRVYLGIQAVWSLNK